MAKIRPFATEGAKIRPFATEGAKIRAFATEGAKISVYVPFFKKLPTPDPEPSHLVGHGVTYRVLGGSWWTTYTTYTKKFSTNLRSL